MFSQEHRCLSCYSRWGKTIEEILSRLDILKLKTTVRVEQLGKQLLGYSDVVKSCKIIKIVYLFAYLLIISFDPFGKGYNLGEDK